MQLPAKAVLPLKIIRFTLNEYATLNCSLISIISMNKLHFRRPSKVVLHNHVNLTGYKYVKASQPQFPSLTQHLKVKEPKEALHVAIKSSSGYVQSHPPQPPFPPGICVSELGTWCQWGITEIVINYILYNFHCHIIMEIYSDSLFFPYQFSQVLAEVVLGLVSVHILADCESVCHCRQHASSSTQV